MIDVTFTAVTKVIIAVLIGAFSSGSIPFVMSTMTDFGFLISAVLLPALTIVNTGRSIDLEVLIECSILVVMQIVFSIAAAVFGFWFQKMFFDVHHQRSAKGRNRNGVSGNFQPHITFRLKYEDAQERAARELALAKRKESSSTFDGSALLPLFREETEEASGEGERSSCSSHHHHHHPRRGGTRSSPSSTTTSSPTSLHGTAGEGWQRGGASPTRPLASMETDADARARPLHDPPTQEAPHPTTPAPSSRQKGVPYVGIRMSHTLRATGVLPEEVLPYIAAPDRDTDYIVGYAWICYVAFVLLNTVTLPLPLIESLAQSMWWVDYEKGSSYVFVYSIPATVLAWTLGPFLVKKAKSETKKRRWMRWLLEEHLIQARLTDAATQFTTTLSTPSSSSPLAGSFPESHHHHPNALDAAAEGGTVEENESLPHSRRHRHPSPAPTRYPIPSASPSISSSSSLVCSSLACTCAESAPLLLFSRVTSGVTCCWCKRYGYDWQQSGLLRFLPTSAKEGEDEDNEEDDDDDEDEEDDEEEDEENAERKAKKSTRESEERNTREFVPFSRSAGTSVASSSSSSDSHGHAEHESNEEKEEEEEEGETHQKGKPKKRSELTRRTTPLPTRTTATSRVGTPSRRKEKWRSLMRAIGRECSQLLRNPPFLSIGIGMLLGLVPPLHRAFFVHGPLEVITDSLVLIAQGNIPASLLLLGANLAGTKQLTLGGGDEEDALVDGDDGKKEEEEEEEKNNTNPTTGTGTPNAKKKKAPHRKQRERVRAEKELLMRAGVRLRHGGSTQLRHAGTSTDEDAILLQALENEEEEEDKDKRRREPSNDHVPPAWRTLVTTTAAGVKCTTAFRTPRWKRPDGIPTAAVIVEVGKTIRLPVDPFSSPMSDAGTATPKDGPKRGKGVVRVVSFSSSPTSPSPLPEKEAKNDDDDDEDTTFTVRWKYNAEGKRICQYPDSMGYRVAFSSAAEEEEDKMPPRSSHFLSSFLQELQGMVSLTGVSHLFVFGVIFFRLLVIPFFFFLLLVFLVKAFPFLFGGRGKEDVTLVLTLFVEVAAPTAINSTIMFAMENFMTYHWAKMLFLQYILSIGSVVLWTFLGLKFTETLVPGNERLEGLRPSL